MKSLIAFCLPALLCTAAISSFAGVPAKNPNTNYYVLGNTDMPSCLVELGFISSPEDNRLLDTHHDAYARTIADGIASILLNEE